MQKAKKTATDNQWCGNCSNESLKYPHGAAKKTATNNQWVSTGLGRVDKD